MHAAIHMLNVHQSYSSQRFATYSAASSGNMAFVTIAVRRILHQPRIAKGQRNKHRQMSRAGDTLCTLYYVLSLAAGVPACACACVRACKREREERGKIERKREDRKREDRKREDRKDIERRARARSISHIHMCVVVDWLAMVAHRVIRSSSLPRSAATSRSSDLMASIYVHMSQCTTPQHHQTCRRHTIAPAHPPVVLEHTYATCAQCTTTSELEVQQV